MSPGKCSRIGGGDRACWAHVPLFVQFSITIFGSEDKCSVFIKILVAKQ